MYNFHVLQSFQFLLLISRIYLSLSVLVRVLFLWRDMTTAALIRKAFHCCWLTVQKFSPLSSRWEARLHAGRHDSVQVAESSTSRWVGSRKRDNAPALSIWTPKGYPQWHPSSNRATPPNPCQLETLPKDNAFKSMSLWRPFLFKPPHGANLSFVPEFLTMALWSSQMSQWTGSIQDELLYRALRYWRPKFHIARFILLSKIT